MSSYWELNSSPKRQLKDFHSPPTLLLAYTVCLNQLGRRNGAVMSLFWEFWGLKQLLCHPKTGRKLLLGQKLTQMVLRIFQNAGQQQRNNQDLLIWAWFTWCPKTVFLPPSSTLSLIILNFGLKCCYNEGMKEIWSCNDYGIQKQHRNKQKQFWNTL